MTTITSRDGIDLAFDIHGSADAPTAVWVHGATAYRAFQGTAALVAELAGLRVLTYDRRGRGESGDAPDYDPQREIDDIAALIDVLGGRVDALIGESSGAILALEAARSGVAASAVIAYEPPFIIDDSRPPLPADYVERLDRLTAAGDFEGAHRLFLTAAVGLPAEFIDGIVSSPMWPLLEPVAPTIAYDGRISRDYMAGSAEPLARFATLETPALVAVGDQSMPFMIDGARALAAAAPAVRVEIIPGGTHQTDPALVSAPFGDFVRSVRSGQTEGNGQR